MPNIGEKRLKEVKAFLGKDLIRRSPQNTIKNREFKKEFRDRKDREEERQNHLRSTPLPPNATLSEIIARDLDY